MTVRLSDEARRVAFAKAERLEAARDIVGKLTDDECQILYLEIEARLVQGTKPLAASAAVEARPAPINVPTELPLAEAKRLTVAAFESDYLARLMARSNGSVTAAARLAGVDRTNFRRLLQRSGLRPRGTRAKKKDPVAKYTDRILEILAEDRRGLRTCEIAEKTRQALQNAFGTLKSLERQGRVERHGSRYDALWTLPGILPVLRVESIPAAAVDVLSRAMSPIDGRRLLDEIGTTLLRSVGKRPSDASLRRGISRLISRGMIAHRGANEHGPLYVLAARKGGAAVPDLN